MPELPEVETVRRGLQELIVGKSVAKVDFDWPKGFPNSPADISEFLIGTKVLAVRRRAKVLLIDLASDYTLVTHLKMTGQLVFVGKKTIGDKSSTDITQPNTRYKLPSTSDEVRYGAGHPNDSLIGKLPDKSTRVTITFSDNSKLFFNDQRKFGWMKLFASLEDPKSIL